MKNIVKLSSLAIILAIGASSSAGLAQSASVAPAAAVQPVYVTIPMSIDVAVSAAEAWKKVGKFCDLSVWMKLDCTIASGTGEIGSVRKLAGGRVTEVLVAKTDLSYGYTQPVVEGKWYNLYHGFLEAKPVTESTSKLMYTLVLDMSNLPDQAARDKEVNGRRARFEKALAEAKKVAEAK